jgi:hypothetical protein
VLFAFATHLVGTAWFARQDPRVQQVLVTKILRVHVVPSVTAREASSGWSERDREQASGTVATIVDAAPGALSSLSLAELDVVDALLDVTCPTEELVSAARAARRFGRPRTLLTRNPIHLLRTDAPLRWILSSAVLKLQGRRAGRPQAVSSSM